MSHSSPHNISARLFQFRARPVSDHELRKHIAGTV